MMHLARIKITNTWTEATGVSGVAGTFKVGNDSNEIMMISVSATTPTNNYERFAQHEFKIIENTGSSKIWVKCAQAGKSGDISILKS